MYRDALKSLRHTDRLAEPDQSQTIFVVLLANLPGSIHTGTVKDSSGEQSHADMGANREMTSRGGFLYFGTIGHGSRN